MDTPENGTDGAENVFGHGVIHDEKGGSSESENVQVCKHKKCKM